MKIKILKCHGSGNDFVLIDEFTNTYDFTEEQKKKLTRYLSDRKGMVGADGVIFFSKSSKADANSRIFNADGSEAELCGNGIRCVARYASELLGKNQMEIETIKSIYSVRKEDDIFNDIPTFSVTIHTVTFDAEDIPINISNKTLSNDVIPGFHEELRFYGIGLTNPHLISVVDDINIELLTEVGQKANNNKEIFPRGINVSFCKFLSDNSIRVETYERGVGLTYSCGTAMSASTLVFSLQNQNKFGQFVNVINTGGMVKCKAEKDGDSYTITLLGNATFVFESEIDFDFDNPDSFKYFKGDVRIEEIENYGKLVDHSKEFLSEFSR